MADKKISALPAATTPLAGTEVLPIVQSGTTDQVSVANLTAGRAVSALSYVTTGGSGNGQITITKNSTVATENTAGLAIQAAAANAYTELLLGTDDAIDSGYIQTAGKNTSYTSKTLVLQPNGGDVKQGAGNVIIGTAAKGINFTANTPAAGKTSQLLNWYEEGTWTPTLTPSTSGTITASGAARYTRVGRLVTVEGYINVSAVSSPVGELRLGGFPFTLSADSNGAGSIQPYGFGITSTNTALYMAGVGGTTYANIRGYLNGAQVQTIANNAQNGAGLQFTFTYSV